jgi:hypothetical protein
MAINIGQFFLHDVIKLLAYLTLYDLTPGLIATVGWHVMCLGIDISHVVNYVPSYWWVM